jgi:GntR family transcriptional regulator/MocR family aminotransferase
MALIQIDRESETSLTRQVYGQIRQRILARQLPAGFRLPATRLLAAELAIARNVVIDAYEQLYAEGFLETRRGAGTFVAQDSYLDEYAAPREPPPPAPAPPPVPERRDVVAFQSGVPDLRRFPRKLWSAYMRRATLEAPQAALDYVPAAGVDRLRRALSGLLLRTKGIVCPPEQVFVLSGSAQAFVVLVELLGLTSTGIVVEDPLYDGIQRIFRQRHVAMTPVAVDEKGIQVDEIEVAPRPILVTPSHQFPFGCILPIQRRVRLIELARRLETYVVENDYDSDFRHVGSPISSLYLLDPGRVIHVGTFSESLYPGLRLGYMLLPRELAERGQSVMANLSLSAPSLPQLALAAFIDEGQLERHMSRMKKLYRRKRERLVELLAESFGDSVQISGDATGLYLVASFAGVRFSDALMERALRAGVSFDRVEDDAIRRGRFLDKIILGYGNLSLAEIEEGLRRLRSVIDGAPAPSPHS